MQWQSSQESNSIAIIVKHMVGNMLSRWTNFMTEDGEKSWQKHDDEFINNFNSFEELIAAGESGWAVLFRAIKSITENDLEKTIFIRHQEHTVTEAINRQLAHYAYHTGQMVFLGKLLKDSEWQSLSISKGCSLTYNQEKATKPLWTESS